MSSSAKKASKMIDQQIHTYSSNFTDKQKVLVFGTKGSGKSTVLKHFKFQFSKSTTDALNQKRILHQLVLKIFQSIISFIDLQITLGDCFEPYFASDDNATFVEQVKQMDKSTFVLTEALVVKFQQLWKDKGFATFLQREKEMNLIPNYTYFIDNMARFAKTDFRPTIQDDCMMPCENQEIIYEFDIANYIYSFIELQHYKCLHILDDVVLIIFVVRLDQFDEDFDYHSTKLMDSLDTFKMLLYCEYLKDIPIHIIFNTSNTFLAKIRANSLQNYFPQYTGGTDYYCAIQFLQKLYTDLRGNRQCTTQCANIFSESSILHEIIEILKHIFLKKSLLELDLL